MESHISVPVQTAQFLELVAFLQSKNDPRDPVEVVASAIEYWLDNADWKPELLAQVDSNVQGYQWKNLFLSNGTQIRMQYKGTYFYAKVEGDKIIYNGKPISPGSLANTITKSSRNAWRDLWIKRPEDKEWKLADDCRPEKIAIGEKLLQELEAIVP
jgi:hypothetical protein